VSWRLKHRKANLKARVVPAAAVGTVAFLVMLFEFPVIPAAPYLKVDLSAVVLATFAILKGNWVSALFIKDFLFFLMRPDPIGVAVDFTLNSIFLSSVYLTQHFLLSSVLTVISGIIVGSIAVKFYTGHLDSTMFFIILQFNVIKWSLIGIVSYWIVRHNKRIVVRLWQKLR